MSLADFLSAPGQPAVSLLPGFADVYPNVRVAGLVQPATWLGAYTVVGEPVVVAKLTRPDAPAQLVCLGRVGEPGPREGTVTAAPAGSDTITVNAGGTDTMCTFLASYTPTVGDKVRLLWQGRDATVLGAVGVSPAGKDNPVRTPPPPGAATAGTVTAAAVDSGTYSSGYGWNSYYGSNLYQGNGSTWGAPGWNAGAWFYGGGAGQAAGATITRVQLRLPARIRAGAFNSPGTVHVWLHSAANRPGGDVPRTNGPVDFTLPAGWGGGWVDLPASWGAALAAGSGIGISGDPYLGLLGRTKDPESGLLRLDWQR